MQLLLFECCNAVLFVPNAPKLLTKVSEKFGPNLLCIPRCNRDRRRPLVDGYGSLSGSQEHHSPASRSLLLFFLFCYKFSSLYGGCTAAAATCSRPRRFAGFTEGFYMHFLCFTVCGVVAGVLVQKRFFFSISSDEFRFVSP